MTAPKLSETEPSITANYSITITIKGFGGVTARELEVLRLIVYGMSDKEIAGELLIKTRTVHTHIAHIRDKIGAANKAQAAAYAVTYGLLSALPVKFAESFRADNVPRHW